ncbi:hypothetical protein [Streptomyces avidinii]
MRRPQGPQQCAGAEPAFEGRVEEGLRIGLGTGLGDAGVGRVGVGGVGVVRVDVAGRCGRQLPQPGRAAVGAYGRPGGGAGGRPVLAPPVDEGGRHEIRVARQERPLVVARVVAAPQGSGRRVAQPQQARGPVVQLVVVAQRGVDLGDVEGAQGLLRVTAADGAREGGLQPGAAQAQDRLGDGGGRVESHVEESGVDAEPGFQGGGALMVGEQRGQAGEVEAHRHPLALGKPVRRPRHRLPRPSPGVPPPGPVSAP